MIITNSALCARFGYLPPHVSDARLWNNCFKSITWGIFSHLMHLDQLRVSKNIWSIKQDTDSLIKRLVITKEWVGLTIA